MVRVPLPQEQLQGGALPGFSAPGVVPQQDATGAQISRFGQALTGAATAAANIADVLQDDLDTAKAKEALTLWNDEKRITMYDPETGYMNKIGKDATGEARINAQNQVAKSAETFSRGLDNDLQRAMFEMAVQEQTITMSQTMDQHEAVAIRTYHTGQAKALSDEFASNAVDFRTLPTPDLVNFQVEFDKSVAEAEKVAELMGMGEAETDALVLKTKTSMHAAVIDRFLKEKNPARAQQYLDSVDKDELTSEARTMLQGVVATANENDQAFDLATEIAAEVDAEAERLIQESPGAMDPQQALRLDADDRLIMARRVLRSRDMPASLRKATLAALEQDFAERADAEAEAVADLVVRSRQALADDLTLPPTELPDEDQFELKRTGQWADINTFARTGRFGGNAQAFATFMGLPHDQLIAITSRQKLILDLVNTGMTTEQRNTVMARWEAARAPTTEAPDRGVTVGEILQILGRRHGLIGSNGFMTSINERIFEQISLDANDRLRDVETVKGRQGGEELRDILNQAFIDGFVTHDPGFWSAARNVLRRDITQAQLFGQPEISVDKGPFIGLGGTQPAIAPAERRFTLEDKTSVVLTVPVFDHLVAKLRAARKRDPTEPRVTLQAIHDLWVTLQRPETLAEIGIR